MIYIGKAVDLDSRLKSHKGHTQYAQYHKHFNKVLYEVWPADQVGEKESEQIDIMLLAEIRQKLEALKLMNQL